MPGCKFQQRWLYDDRFKSWVKAAKHPSYAFCFLCHKDIDLSGMGECALKSHAAGKKHKSLDVGKRENLGSLTTFFKPKSTPVNVSVVEEKSLSSSASSSSFTAASSSLSTSVSSSSSASASSSSSASASSSSSASASSSSSASASSSSLASAVSPSSSFSASSSSNNLSNFVSKESTLTAEIIWTLHSINSHHSFRSNAGISQTFQRMFPDSLIAQRFGLSERKTSYLTCFGIAPYFSSLLKDKVKNNSYVLLFDESMNKSLQSKQMDFHLRLWDEDTVVTRYFTSKFLGHATAKDMEKVFNEATDNLYLQDLLQLSMDGPNVNWSFHNSIDARLNNEFGLTLLNTGSCGLHKVHGSCKRAMDALSWDLDKTLKAMHTLFKDTPARREDYTSVTKSAIFPLEFCKHRWLENTNVAQRASQIIGNLQTYVKMVQTSQLPNPNTESFDRVRKAIEDPLLPAKLAFFASVSYQVEPFLREYQSDKPMLPFIHQDLTKLGMTLLKRFIKSSELECVSVKTLFELNVKDKQLHCPGHKVDIGFVAETCLSQLKKEKKISDGQILGFKNDCKSFLVSFCEHFLSKSPLQYSLVVYMACLDPARIMDDKKLAEGRMKKLLHIFISRRKYNAFDSEKVVNEFSSFIDQSVQDGSLSSFKKDNQRLDHFFHAKLSNNQEFKHLWKVVKDLLLLSHGQATVERGFSVNKEVEDVNMAEKTVVARRVIVDNVRAAGGVCNIQISPKLLVSAASAYSKYSMYLSEQKEMAEEKKRGQKRKAATEEIEELKKKKAALSSDIEALTIAANDYSLKAETLRDIRLVTKSNSMRRTAQEKEQEKKCIEKLLDEKLEHLKTSSN